MGSGYYGEMNMGSNNNNGGSSSSTSGSSSRRKKKSSNSPNKPKQPQRGLGVAQLEKIRLHGQLGCTSYFPNGSISSGAPFIGHHNNLNYTQEAYGSVHPSGSSYSFHQPNMMMGFDDMERPNMGWNLNNSTPGYGHDSQQVHYSEADYMTRSFFSGQDAQEARRNNNDWGRSGSHDSGSSDIQQEVDLELRL